MPSALAFCRVAVGVRFSLRATVLVFVFSRTSVFSMRTSSFVHARDLFGFFAIVILFVSREVALISPKTIFLQPREIAEGSGPYGRGSLIGWNSSPPAEPAKNDQLPCQMY